MPEPWDISVVVPTLDGGADLGALVDSLLAQRGVRLEILVLDSESTDGSPSLAALSPVIRWVTRPRGEFSHSATRNLGVSLARHPLVFLTVQDAVLPTPTDLCRLAALLSDGGWGAVSVAENPRDDAEPYARYGLDSYYQGLFDRGPTRVDASWSGPPAERILAASVGNVACLYRRDLLVRHPFEGTFAEDFDWAVRLLKAGVFVAKTSEVRVVHSHNRSAYYAFQRMFLSRRLMVSHGVAEPGAFTTEAGPRWAASDLLALFSPASLGQALDEVRALDPTLAGLVEALSLPRLTPGVGAELAGALTRARDWGGPLVDTDPVFRLKVLAGALGWLVGGVDGAVWTNGRRSLAPTWGEGV